MKFSRARKLLGRKLIPINLGLALTFASAISLMEPQFVVSPSFAATPDKQTESSIMVQLVAPIRPVPGADGQNHLVYELLLVNQSAVSVTINSIAVLDGENEAMLKKIDGESLTRKFAD